MGRNTAQSLPQGYLPNRHNIILSRNKLSYKTNGGWNVITCRVCEIPDAIDTLGNPHNIWLIGGGQIYQELMKVVTEVHLTRLLNSEHMFPGADVFFPDVSEWDVVSNERYEDMVKLNNGHSLQGVLETQVLRRPL
jgi:dihydrofolate reductase